MRLVSSPNSAFMTWPFYSTCSNRLIRTRADSRNGWFDALQRGEVRLDVIGRLK